MNCKRLGLELKLPQSLRTSTGAPGLLPEILSELSELSSRPPVGAPGLLPEISSELPELSSWPPVGAPGLQPELPERSREP